MYNFISSWHIGCKLNDTVPPRLKITTYWHSRTSEEDLSVLDLTGGVASGPLTCNRVKEFQLWQYRTQFVSSKLVTDTEFCNKNLIWLRLLNILKYEVQLNQARSTFYEVQTNSAELGLHVDNMKPNTQNEVWMSIRTITCIISKCSFYTSCCSKNTLIIIRNIYSKIQFTTHASLSLV